MNKDLITPVNTRIIYYLSGDHDQDLFGDIKNEMSESHYELLMGCYHVGQCYEDCVEAAQYFDFPSYQAYENALNYLLECGIEKETFETDLEYYTTPYNPDTILQYYLWILSGDIQTME